VIDTGIAWNHPDLAPNVVHHDCYSSSGICEDYPDASYDDEGYHGTLVAGIIAAAFGGGAVVGVGPDLGLASYKVFEQNPDCGFCAYDDSIWEAMLDAVARGYEVINMSLGGYVVFPEGPENAANWTAWNRVANYVTRQGVTIVAAAGNDDLDLNGPVAHVPSDLPGVISVGATGIRPDPLYPQSDAYDVRAFYSNFGAATTMVAPGGDFGPPGTPFPYPGGFYLVPTTFVAVPGTLPGITPWTPGYDPGCEVNENCPVGYFFVGGTSISSPHVAGTAALVIDQTPDLNPHQVQAILKRTAEDLGDRQQFGHGMVDVAAAVNE
jgi:subtilisin family serine protease